MRKKISAYGGRRYYRKILEKSCLGKSVAYYPQHFKEFEFRYNYRNQNIYLVLLRELRNK